MRQSIVFHSLSCDLRTEGKVAHADEEYAGSEPLMTLACYFEKHLPVRRYLSLQCFSVFAYYPR
jgi:hypothetical protein